MPNSGPTPVYENTYNHNSHCWSLDSNDNGQSRNVLHVARSTRIMSTSRRLTGHSRRSGALRGLEMSCSPPMHHTQGAEADLDGAQIKCSRVFELFRDFSGPTPSLLRSILGHLSHSLSLAANLLLVCSGLSSPVRMFRRFRSPGFRLSMKMASRFLKPLWRARPRRKIRQSRWR